MILTLAAWLATAAILLSYARTTQDPAKANAFHAANVFGCIPLIILNVQAAVWPAVVVNLGFGIPAAWALWKRSRRHTAAVVTLQDQLDEFFADLERVSGVSDLQRGFIAGEPTDGEAIFPAAQYLTQLSNIPPGHAYLLNPETIVLQPVQDFGYWDQDVEDRYSDRSPHHPDYTWKETT